MRQILSNAAKTTALASDVYTQTHARTHAHTHTRAHTHAHTHTDYIRQNFDLFFSIMIPKTWRKNVKEIYIYRNFLN
jgi:hypothetical protein